MSALDNVLKTPAPLPRETAAGLLNAARAAYRDAAALKAAEIELLTFGQTAMGQLSRFDTTYDNVIYSTDYFVDEITWRRAQMVTRDLAGIAGVVGDQGIETATSAVQQLGADLVDGTKQLADDVGDALPLVVLGLVALAVIVVLK